MTKNQWMPAGFVVLAVWTVGLTTTPAHAEQSTTLAKTDAPLVVDGVVRQVFRSAKSGRNEYLVQIDVLRSEGRKSPTGAARLQFPGPGESMYVHVAPQGAGASSNGLPDDGTQVRAYLTPRDQASWAGVLPDWYDLAEELPATGKGPSRTTLESGLPRTGDSRLGMTTEALKIQNQIALRVTSVERAGPAQESGLEVGDIIAGANGELLTDENALDELAAAGKKFTLIVVDVNTGQGAQVEVDPNLQPANPNGAGQTANSPARVSLGMSAEPVTLGLRSALKVTGVEPNGPAANAGLEPGDILVAANGAPITGPEQLLGALRKSGPKLKLTVRDVRTGRDAEIEVNLGGGRTAQSLPSEVDSPLPTTHGNLGAVTELAFHDDDFAVKVTEVEPGSPAARAGLRPGVMILAANGLPVLHPNDLSAAVRKATGVLKLAVIDPATGKRGTIDVNLGR